jgi:coxsackievirus/adenovirus receptor
VQSAANEHRAKLKELEKVLSNIASSPTVISDQDFEKKLRDVQGFVEGLWNDARRGAGSMIHIKILCYIFYNDGEDLNFGIG